MRENLKHICLGFFISLTFLTCNFKKETDEGASGESYLSFTADGAWCWFSDPRAVYYEGDHKRTYSGWVDSLGNIVVGSYDHDDGKILTKILHERFEKDDHDNPSFFVDSEGKLMVFYSRHATGNSPIFLARSKSPEDILQWESVTALAIGRQ